MDNEENVFHEVISDFIDGSVSCQYANGVRRTCNLTFKNDDGLYTPSQDGLIYINKKLKIYSGLKIDGVDYFPPESVQGVFNIGNPIVRSTSGGSVVTIEGYDNYSLLNGTIAGTIYSTIYQISINTTISDAVIAIMSDANIVKTPRIYENYLPRSQGTVLPYTLVKDAGSTYADALFDLANMIA
jgi:hypothetical protein